MEIEVCVHMLMPFYFIFPSYIKNKMCCVLSTLVFKPLIFLKKFHELMAYLMHQCNFVILSNLSFDVSIKILK
jgi:hypothetical protein